MRGRERKIWLKLVGENGGGINSKSVVQVGSGGTSGMITDDLEKIFEPQSSEKLVLHKYIRFPTAAKYVPHTHGKRLDRFNRTKMYQP